MRKTIAILLVIMLLAVTVSAQSPFVVDASGLLSQTEAENLESSFSNYYTQYGFTVAAVTVDDLGGMTAAECAAEQYAANGYGNDGVLLLICENEGQWYIYTSGICAQVITDADAALIGDAMMNSLQSGDYYGAFKTFGEMSAEPVCKQVSANAAAAALLQSSQKKYVFLGLFGGLVVGVVAVVLLKVFAIPARKPRRASPAADDQNPVM